MGKKKNRENSLKLKQYRNENFLLFIYIYLLNVNPLNCVGFLDAFL